MMKLKLINLILVLCSIFIVSCNDPAIPDTPNNNNNNDTVEEVDNSSNIVSDKVIFTVPENIESDKAFTLYFAPKKDSPLYDYKGDIYVHAGIVDESGWKHVPADWNTNIEQCKMTKVEDNKWKLEFSPTIRQWFKADNSEIIVKIGIVIRNEDGSKKGIEADTFLPVKDTKFVFKPIIEKSLPEGMEMGLNIKDSKLTFVLYDKDNNGNYYKDAYLIGNFNDWKINDNYRMFRDNNKGLWWISIDKTSDIIEYQYNLINEDKTVKVADPYSTMVLMPEDHYIPASTYPNMPEYPSQTTGAVSYINLSKQEYNWRYSNNFKAVDKDNLLIYELLIRDFTDEGTIKAVKNNLDYIANLGVNAIELMPVQEFDGNDSWGYNPCFYFALDKAYGTDDDYKDFIDECHKRGIAVIFDIVYNHATKNFPYASLYWDSTKQKPSSNNPWFNVDAPHPYSVFVDFNHESKLVKDFFERNLNYLIDNYKIDGLRFDLSKGFTQRHSNESNVNNYDEQRVAILSSYYNSFKDKHKNTYAILEHFAEYREEKELAEKGFMLWRNMNHQFAEAAMGYSKNSSFESMDAEKSGMPKASLVSFIESHDEERIAFKQKEYAIPYLKNSVSNSYERLKMLAAFELLDRGPKMIWQFQELGYDLSIEQGGRTGKKTSYLSKKDEKNRKDLYNTYKKLIEIRKNIFKSGYDMPYWDVSKEDWNRARFIQLSANNKNYYLIANFGTEQNRSFDLNGSNNWTELITEKVLNGKHIELEPNKFVIYRSN